MKFKKYIQKSKRYTINESGIRDIKKLSKYYDKAIIYFHIDLDGVTSALGIKSYLKQYGIKTIDAVPIQYGNQEYEIKVPPSKTRVMNVLVDFASGKYIMNIHTDHHDRQTGVLSKELSKSFKTAKSNAATISTEISPKDIFPREDIKIINTVDSADFQRHGITVDDVMRSSFKMDYKATAKIKKLEIAGINGERWAMGLATNKLLLTYKNKPNFLRDLVLNSKPSLISIYNNIKKLAKKNRYDPPKDIERKGDSYVSQQARSAKKPYTSPMALKNGESTMWGTTIVQYGGGKMFPKDTTFSAGQGYGGKQYDRYVPFKIWPQADFLCMGWGSNKGNIGLVQISKNPFISGQNLYNLGEIARNEIIPAFKSEWDGMKISLYMIKKKYESGKKFASGESIGYKFADFFSQFEGKIFLKKDIDREIIKRAANMDIKTLERHAGKKYGIETDERELLNALNDTYVKGYDIITTLSGGHKDITNISGLELVYHDTERIVKRIQTKVAKVMKEKRLRREDWDGEL